MPYNHKKLALPLCAALLLSLFTACGGKADASSAPAASAAVSSSAASAPSSAVSKAASAAASVEAASSSAAQADTKAANVTVQTSDGQTAVLVLQIPSDWTFDGYSTFSRGDTKIAEVATVWKVADPAAPFSAEMTDYFAHPELADGPQYSDGYGLVETTDRNVNNRLTRTYLYKTIPADASSEWYPHYMFHVIDSYVLQMHCYSFDKTADDATFDSVLAGAQLVFP